MKQKVIRAGKHSLAVIIPADFIHALGIKASSYVEVQTQIDKGNVSLHFSGAQQLPLLVTKKSKDGK
ncbi:hypothetical protein A2960_03570 [Candidatus Gottesmanbacteria bacterium RIFCSPLOWO2_01_FULL_39_12b]|uniref:SpoVT-AbrB domain-containing protein n=1 Tax=Candidatus Gottesmanbacteria bacterium RIFCSPLOWO2_01_FULL_39_12b TaxID=1798388 RepID=A0A1F6APF5_9BACT|nr:MAG: hypothetical protein A2960_03570 [Candidatus Gottesmanbacteria bacterium RIFCSPLOWO2_01_FULL_39_12b]